MNILAILAEALDKAEPNVLGNRFAKVEIGGNTYSATASTAGSHQSAANWGRIDYRMNGKRIAKEKLQGAA